MDHSVVFAGFGASALGDRIAASGSKLVFTADLTYRKGKDVAHVVALDKGGSNKDGLRIESASKNRSFKRDSKGNLVSETSKKERKRT